MISHYEFGRIIIGQKEYQRDVAVFWDGTVKNWVREKSHAVGVGDIEAAIGKNPQIIVIGTGADGIAIVTPEATKAVVEKGLDLVIEKTGEAVPVFNANMAAGKRVAGLFHLTC